MIYSHLHAFPVVRRTYFFSFDYLGFYFFLSYFCGKFDVMNNCRLIFFLLLWSFILISCGESPSKKDTNDKFLLGRIVVEPKKYDLGRIDKSVHKKIKHEVNINNISDRQITITDVDVSCGCISVKLKSNTLKPGSSTKLIFEINTTHQRGYFNKVIYVNSDAENSLELVRVKDEIVE